jgi:hypothetical protein
MPKSSTARLVLYVSIAVVSAASAGIATVDFADARQLGAFILGVLATGLTTARSYIDRTAAEKSVQP